MRITLLVDVHDERVTPTLSVQTIGATHSGTSGYAEDIDTVRDGNETLAKVLDFADGLKR